MNRNYTIYKCKALGNKKIKKTGRTMGKERRKESKNSGLQEESLCLLRDDQADHHAANSIAMSTLTHCIQCIGEITDGSVDVMQFIQTKQTDAEGFKVYRFVTLQRHTCGSLQTSGDKFLG